MTRPTTIRTFLATAVVALALAGLATAAQAASPAWKVLGATAPTNLPPAGTGTIVVYGTNVGGAPTAGTVDATVSLPAGIVTSATPPVNKGWTCLPAGVGQSSLNCANSEVVLPGYSTQVLQIPVAVEAAATAESFAELSVSGAGGGLASYREPITVSSSPALPGVQAFWAGTFDADGEPSTQAGAHPSSAETGFLLNTILSPSGEVVPAGDPRNVAVELPPGWIGNPLATPRCAKFQLLPPSRCPDDAIVGQAENILNLFTAAIKGRNNEVKNAEAPIGYPAEFIVEATTTEAKVLGELRSDSDYGITATAFAIPQSLKIFGSFIKLDGAPAGSGTAFLTNPTDCAEQALAPPVTGISADSWQLPGTFDSHSVTTPAATGCDRLQFHPSFRFQPSSSSAASGTAATAELSISQAGLLNPDELAPPDLKTSVVTLPPGLSLNPAAANGLQACSTQQIGLIGTGFPAPNPIRFDKSESRCPEASRLGTVEVETPLLEEKLEGTIYLAAQEDNPFHSLLALYLVVDDPKTGIVLKLPGEVRPDPQSGRLTATFDDNPQLPFEDLKLHFRGGGPRSPLATPVLCGTYATHGELTPWSAPESGPPAQTVDSFTVNSGPPGFGCIGSEAERPFSPSFEAGTTSTQAGAYAPLVIKLARKDGEQELTHLEFTLPKGLTGKLAGIPYCSDQAIAAAGGKTGRAEQADPSCPAASEIGTVDTSAGVGPEPIHVGGKAYLAGPYKGAPLSSVVITPAVAGPFDLGTVVVRAPLFVNPETAQITAKSDEIPHILKGIPLQVRSVEIKVDRGHFTLNPTNCTPMTVGAGVGGLNGGSATPSSRFQVGNCSSLPFRPNLKLRLKGATKRVGHPALKAVVTYPKGGTYANIGRAQVNLPHGEFLDQGNLNKTCTKPVLLAGNCPKTSVYGKAKAWTPLLDKPLEGNVYLVGGYGYKLPALVAELNGQIRILLVGKVDSGKNKGIRNTFEVVPDAPVSRFVLEMKGGKKYGLLENSENLCRAPKAKRRALVRFTGQNGKVRAFKPVVQNQCGKGRKAKKKSARHGRATS